MDTVNFPCAASGAPQRAKLDNSKSARYNVHYSNSNEVKRRCQALALPLHWINVNSILENEMIKVVDTKVQAAQLDHAYRKLIASSKPNDLLAIARGNGIGAYLWSRPVEALLTQGGWNAENLDEDKVDVYLPSVMSSLPRDNNGVNLDLKYCKWWLKDLGIADVNLDGISPRLSGARRDRAIERLLLSSTSVIEALRVELMNEVPDVLEDIENALESYQGLPSRFEKSDQIALNDQQPCLF